MNINASERTIVAVAAALGRAALFDDKITADDKARIAAWSEALDPFGIDQATMLNAVTAYYRDPRDRSITVGELTRIARDIRQVEATSESLAALEERNLRNDIKNGLEPPSALTELQAAPPKVRGSESETFQYFRRSQRGGEPAQAFVGTGNTNRPKVTETESMRKAAQIVAEFRLA
ncbi:hypothetical protein [Rhodococcus sp. NPDC055024]